MRSIIILAVLIAGALPGSAVAATVVAHGSGPDAVVDRDGVTHLVWNEHHDYNTPDVLHYCRIPPGAAACDSVRSFVPTASGATADFNGPHVMVTPFGEVLLYTERCCATTILGRSTQAGVVYTSADGGTTFDSGVATVSNTTTVGGHRVFFDGADRRIFTLALTSGGVSVQGAPLGQWTTARAQLTTASPVAGNIVQRERNSFVAAWAGLNDRLNIRTFTCTLDPCPQAQPNSAANWSPVVSIPDAGDPILASGPSGTFVAYPSTVAGDRRWSVRTLDGTAVGAPLPIGNGYSAGADLIEDAGGILHMAYQGLKDLLVYRTSADGGATWGAEKVIISAGSGGFGGTRLVARTTDAGFVGAAIYVAGIDSIVMAPLPAPAVSLPQPPAPPAPPGGGTTTPPPPPAPPAPPAACRLLSFAAIDVVAEGCLVRDGDAYVATGNVKLNGLKAEGKLRFEPNQRRIVSTGPVTFKLGDTTLMKLAVDWTLPKGSVASVGTFDVGGSLLGFPIKGSAEVKFRGGGVEIPLHLGLPALFGGVSGDLAVRADNVAGVHLRELHVKVGDALIGPLELKNLAFDYNADQQTWGGAATLVLPP